MMKDRSFFKRLTLMAVVLLLILAVGSTCLAGGNVALQKSNDAKGKLTQLNNGVKVVSLYGSYYEMGRQYGLLLKTDLEKWSGYYNKYWRTESPHLYSQLTKTMLEKGNDLFTDKRIKDFVDGMSDSSGIKESDLLVLSQALAFDFTFSKSGTACSFFSVYGEKTAGGHTLVGRNLDLQKPLAVHDYNSVITVMHPDNGDHRIATFSFVGFPQGYALINLDNMVFVEYNTGNSSAEGTDIMPGSLDMMDVAFAAVSEKANSDAEGTANYIMNRRTLAPAFFGVADRKGAYVVQRPLKQPSVRTDTMENGIVAFTNVYLDPGPGIKLTIDNASTAPDAASHKLDTPARGMVRYRNIVDFVKSKGKSLYSIEDVKYIMSTNIANGGLFITGYEQKGTSSYCEDDANLGAVALDISDLSQVYWMRYDYNTKLKQWDTINLNDFIK